MLTGRKEREKDRKERARTWICMREKAGKRVRYEQRLFISGAMWTTSAFFSIPSCISSFSPKKMHFMDIKEIINRTKYLPSTHLKTIPSTRHLEGIRTVLRKECRPRLAEVRGHPGHPSQPR